MIRKGKKLAYDIWYVSFLLGLIEKFIVKVM